MRILTHNMLASNVKARLRCVSRRIPRCHAPSHLLALQLSRTRHAHRTLRTAIRCASRRRKWRRARLSSTPVRGCLAPLRSRDEPPELELAAQTS
jgi:hypothetical protein